MKSPAAKRFAAETATAEIVRRLRATVPGAEVLPTLEALRPSETIPVQLLEIRP